MKRIVVSDVHMGAGRSFKEGYAGHVYDWLSEDEAQSFAAFLQFLISDNSVNEIVLLGDIMDTWVCPVEEVPPTFEEIVNAEINRDIVNNLRILAAQEAKKLIYIPGNHDVTVTKDFLESNFRGIAFQTEYSTDSLLAQHGHEYTMFCAPDPKNDPENRLPLGYYISRVAATNAAKTGSDNSFRYYLDEFIDELSKSKTLIKAIFDAIAKVSNLDDNTEIKMYSGSMRIKDVKNRYAKLYKQWDANSHFVNAREALVAEINALSSVPWKLSTEKNYRIIIFGHTHDKYLGVLSKHDADENTYLYANSGTWCDYREKGRKFTFIESEEKKEEGKHLFRLKSWENGNARLLQEESVML